MGNGRPKEKDRFILTTKSPEYIEARMALALGDPVTITVAALLLGLGEEAVRNRAQQGLFGARMVDGRYEFDPDLIRAEIGLA